MARSNVVPASELQVFNKDYLKGYIRASGMAPFMGKSNKKVIRVYEDLSSGGRSMNVPVVNPLKGLGTGTGVLAGNEEAINNDGMRVMPVWRRNGVSVDKEAQEVASLDMYAIQREAVQDWSKRDFKYRLLDAFTGVAFDPARYSAQNAVEEIVPYDQATATQRNTFITLNPDRVFFGNAEALTVGGNYAASLGNVTGTMTPSRAILDSIKALATRESRTNSTINALAPMAFGADGVEKFVWFMGTRSFNRFKADMESANLNGRPREQTNIVFAGGIQEYNGVYVIEVPELDSVAGSNLGAVGASSAPVFASYFCGAGALAAGWAQRPVLTKDSNDDYGFLSNVGVEERRSLTKVMFSGRQHGMVTAHLSA
ncbi:MAG: DUF4043 family protein [Bosea sp. (in: a-proteobacteria)]